MKKIILVLLLFPSMLLAYNLSGILPEKTPALPSIDEIFTVAIANPQKHLFDEKSFMKVYSKLKPARIREIVGINRVWQNGVIVLRNKKVIFWSTCDARFILIDSPQGKYSYGISAEIDLNVN